MTTISIDQLPDERARLRRTVLTTLLVWAGAAALLGATGLFAELSTWLIPLPIVVGMAVPVAAYLRVPRFRRFGQGIDIRILTGFNAWRIPAALVFFAYGANGELPAVFVRNAAWGDLAAGVLAIVAVAALGADGRRHRAGYTAFHLFSFGDFVVAVGTGLAYTLGGDTLMANFAQWPIALIPLFGVPVTGAVSIMTLHRLATRGR